MSDKILKEIEEKMEFVLKEDRDAINKNKEYYRGLWLNLIILSSAIIIGVLPIINDNSSLIKSIFLAKLGLALIIFVIILGLIYYNNVLDRERSLLFDLWQLHEKIFINQLKAIKNAVNEEKDETEINRLFINTKHEAFKEEESIRIKNLVGGKLNKIRLFIDKYLSSLLCYGFLIGLVILLASFFNLNSKF